jgi:hypothetical protein
MVQMHVSFAVSLATFHGFPPLNLMSLALAMDIVTKPELISSTHRPV